MRKRPRRNSGGVHSLGPSYCSGFWSTGGGVSLWAPSAGFIVPDSRQEVIGIKEVGLVEYRFQPDSFEVRHVRAPGQTDVDLESLLAMVPKSY